MTEEIQQPTVDYEASWKSALEENKRLQARFAEASRAMHEQAEAHIRGLRQEIVRLDALRERIVPPLQEEVARLEDAIEGLDESVTELIGEKTRLLDVLEAAEAVIENDQHIDFGVEPPGWRQTHQALHEAVRRYRGG